ncbi:PAC2 family protein [Candidatus Bathyarchaeota archaeon]|nr:PAC2 family protein [Candidatus Bathyarchaeota archaeon]
MNKPYLRILKKPKLIAPTFIVGLPGFGNVGKIAAELLIEFTEAERFAELYSPYFADYVIIDQTGICRLPRYEFYSCQISKPNLVIATGDMEPSFDETCSHYVLCAIISDFVLKLGCRRIITLGGYPVSTSEIGKVYVAATSGRIAAAATRNASVIYKEGQIAGAAGLLLGLAKLRGVPGLCILGHTTGIIPDRQAALTVFRYLVRILRLKRIKT